MTSPATGPFIRREIGDDGVCLLTFDRPDSGANIFDAGAMHDLSEHLDFLEKEASLKGLIVTSAKKSIFIAGADLQTLLRQAQTGEMRAFIAEGQRVFNRLAALKIPTVAAIHGACAGGGYEITLACDYRVASDSAATRIGLPETTLGLVPAWGGATRLPRLIGPEKAGEVILKGKLYSAAEAGELGLVDEVVSPEKLLEAARAKLVMRKHDPPEGRASARPVSDAATPVKAPKSQNPAPARAAEIINRSLTSSTEESLARELDAIVELGATESTRNLIRNFFLADRYRKGSSKSPVEKFNHAAVIGAGVMGSGIAQWLSSRGISVILRDVSTELLGRGLANIEKTYGEAVKRGLMSEEKAQEGRSRIVASANPGPMRHVQIVVEAASEKLAIKKEIFRDLDTKIDDTDILATNTSALSISELAAETKHPERVIGLHFFNPVSRMKLIEVVIGKQTSDETKARALAFARQIGKVPVVVKDSPGFLVNRVLFPYLLDAAALFEQGVDAKKIDDALLEWGMPMGPLRLIDEIGIDITVDIAATLEKSLGARGATPAILQKMQEAKMLGRKTGSGFYKYEGKKQSTNEAIEQWRTAVAGAGDAVPGLGRGDAADQPGTASPAPASPVGMEAEDLALRLVYLMVNEAARCLEEKVVAAPEDADYGMILGTGFAPLRGGPLRFADSFGAAQMVEAGDRHGGKFQPCDLLRQHAQNKTKFYEDTARSA
ncbi:MAG: 3-hydroxyacyl-CoA dehydrogenase NAD-binding domain-containing protein [Verrucomicrobiota bacterium]|nr:3-hydroxyacyl-CoA dehydrogenase NAD-binding domain-containing protein [Verrucomicrobiota bacterium]